jgi:peptidoglycan hydrolase-like protein with peptidoglycan-binding domain
MHPAEPNKSADAASNSAGVEMKIRIVILILMAFAAAIRADQTLSEVQQALKDQGFYYGDVTGEKNADTTAAIRRYQIRNGLQVTGELDEQTLKSIRSAPSTSTPPPVATATAPPANTPQSREESAPETEPNAPAPMQPYGAPPQDRSATGRIRGGEQLYPPPNAPTGPPLQGGLFADTPYESAPPDVQRDIVAAAQRALAAHGFYHGEMDGAFGSALEFSLRAYQARVRLPVTGRLDLETLAALELLPGARSPVYRPRHRRLIPRVRGGWMRP